MKNIKLKVLTKISNFTAFVAANTVSAASVGLYHQPKTPKKLKK